MGYQAIELPDQSCDVLMALAVIASPVAAPARFNPTQGPDVRAEARDLTTAIAEKPGSLTSAALFIARRTTGGIYRQAPQLR